MKNMIRIVTTAVITAVISLSTAATFAQDQVVRIGWLRAPNDITLAKSRGTLEKALAEKGIRVQWEGPFPAAAPAFEALNAGAIDITAGSSTAVAAALAANIPVAVFGYQKMAAGAEGIVVKANSGLENLKALEGKKVAVNRGGTGEYLLVQGLEKNGIDPGSVERVYLSPSDSGPSFSQDHVDAWATWDPFVTIAEETYGGQVLADGDAIGSDNAVVLVSSRSFADEQREELQAIFDVLKAENNWATENKTEAGKIWVEEMKIPTEFAERIGENNAVPTTAVTDADIEQMGKIAEWYVKNGIIPTMPDIKAGTVKLK
ncbi:aliphatic sulfonate ABC transporter substrate-binding protein [Limoniibacter endophyticus]|uniref:ABC transporter substrate-binding protein n=1 Tax=Limoniibacter endophyticus TaxID=1565040 RepID=A0A8J3DPR4_9HYPH|nr:aliphatic sulfonate ABC transporter substrate-binding protein [Limoniibacter endophyticus]GHC71643.1 ABC transporter substrate-binding protein [Limoniibacter endophyticus]